MSRNALSMVPAEEKSQRRYVLLVDDDDDFAEGLASALELNDYEVSTAHDIASALAATERRLPDMAILDIRVGNESGIDLLIKLLAKYPGLPCIMATAHAELDTAIRAVKCGAYDYLRKPLHTEELLAVLARCNETLRLREETALAQNAARRERALLFDAIKSIADGFSLYDSDDKLILFNDRLQNMLDGIGGPVTPGVGFETIIRSAVLRGRFPAAAGRAEEFIQERLERHRDPKGPFELEMLGGRRLRVEERVTGDGGRICLYSDVTAQRHMEEALIESESRFEDMVANVPGVVFQMEMPQVGEAAFRYVSPSAAGFLNLDPERVMDNPSLWFDLVHPDDRAGLNVSLIRSTKDLKPWTWEGRMMLDSGSVWWCQGAARPKRLPDGATLWNGIILDVTERKELEEQLLQTQRMKVVGQLSGGIAHDFNNLMLAAMLNIESARDAGEQAGDAERHLDHALKSLASAKELTRRLLAFSRRQPLDPRPTDLNKLVSEITDLVRRTGGDIVIDERLEESLGYAMVDPRQLESALINLALNARDAMPGGGGLTIATRNVTLDANFTDKHEEIEPGAFVMIDMTDTGSGMARDVAERAFEPFFTTKEVGAGSGLGLSMVYGFVKQSRGHISLDSQPGKGTTVTLYLPRAGEQLGVLEPVTAEAGPNSMPGGHETILVVEDEPGVRTIVVQLLENLGYTVVAAKNGVEALERLNETGEIDILFTDIVLPGGMNGKQVATEVQKRQPAVKLLYTSGYAAGATDAGGRIADGGEFLAKPYLMNTLADRIRKILDTPVD